jgi:phospholipase C
MMCGHSYDNYLGDLGRGDGLPIDPTWLSPSPSSAPAATLFHSPTTLQSVPEWQGSAAWKASHGMLAAGLAAPGEMSREGFLRASASRRGDPDWPLRYWTDQDLPFYHKLARTFPVADRWFASCLGPTNPNRRFLIAGTALGATTDFSFEKPGKPHAGTIFDWLDHCEISWANYFDDSSLRVHLPVLPGTRIISRNVPWLAYLIARTEYVLQRALQRFRNFRRLFGRVHCTAGVYKLSPGARWGNLRRIDEFFAQAANGTLPSVCFVDPAWAVNSEDAPQDIRLGEKFAHQVVTAVMSGKGWPRSLLVWLYDDHGGYYDHVPPPVAVPPDDVPPRDLQVELPAWLRALVGPAGKRPPAVLEKQNAAPQAYDRLGFRVPAVVVSPYARPGFVSSQVYDHTAVLRLIEQVWNLPSLTRRDAASADLISCLDMESPPAFLQPPDLGPADPWIPWNPFGIRDSRSLARAVLTVCAAWAVGAWSFTTGNLTAELLVLVILGSVAGRLVFITEFWRKWLFWRPYPSQSDRRSAVFVTIVALLSLTVLFALVSALLHDAEIFHATQSMGNRSVLYYTSDYAWSAVDAIPAVDITDTFNWPSPLTLLDPLSRVFLIAYRILVLAPVIQLGVELLQNDHS